MVIIRDRWGLFWIGTEGGGLDCYDNEKKIFLHIKNNPADLNSLSNNFVWSLKQDSRGNLWIGTKEGLNLLTLSNFSDKEELFSAQKLRFERFNRYASDTIHINAAWIVGISEDSNGNMWIGTYGNGLHKFDILSGKFYNYKNDPFDKNSIGINDIKPVYCDPRGQALWVGTDGAGVFKHARNQKPFNWIGNKPGDINSLAANTVYGMTEDSRGNIWIGTQTRGVEKYDPVQKKFMHFPFDPQNQYSPPSKKVNVIYEDFLNKIWIGTAHGLARFDYTTNRFIRYNSSYNREVSRLPEWVYGIFVDSLHNPPIMWLGGYDGLYKIDPREDTSTHFKHNALDSNSLINDNITLIYGEYLNNNLYLWIGTENGLDKFDVYQNKFHHFLHDPGNPESISNNSIYCIYRDTSGKLWIGTYGGGLNLLNEENNTFTYFTEKNGLSNNIVIGILEDDTGNLWLSTLSGLSKFNPDSKQFTNYNEEDGMNCSEFWIGSFFKSHTGALYFGGNNGIVYFNPDSIKENTAVPPVVLTDFQVFNKSVLPGEKSPLRKPVSEANEIILLYDQDIFTIEFSALDYTAPMKNQYAYKLSDVNADWVYTDAKRRFATYTKLNPGEFIFRVKGSNNDGVWNETGTSIKIIILPPWYSSKIAYALYLLALISLVVGTWKLQVNRLHQKHQRELEHLEAEKLKEVDQAQIPISLPIFPMNSVPL